MVSVNAHTASDVVAWHADDLATVAAGPEALERLVHSLAREGLDASAWRAVASAGPRRW